MKPTRGNDYAQPRVAFGELAGARLAVISLPAALPAEVAARLSAAEREIAIALVDGAAYAAIAQQRGSAQRTVANQVRSIFRKLGVGSRAELIMRVARDGR